MDRAGVSENVRDVLNVSFDKDRFLSELRELAEDYRWSDEYIGIWVRGQWPRRYDK